VAFILLSSIHIVIYSNECLWKSLSRLNWTQGKNPPDQSIGGKYQNYQETKNFVIGSGNTFVAVAMITLFMVSVYMAQMYLREDENGINFGMGRTWSYIGRMTMPVLSFIILPSVIIVSNSKMRKVLLRELKDTIASFN
jgi:hypothetical protein